MVLTPSPAVSWKGRLVAYSTHAWEPPPKVLSADTRICTTPTLSLASSLSVAFRDVVKLAPLLIETLPPVGLRVSATRVQASGFAGESSTLPTLSVARERKQ